MPSMPSSSAEPPAPSRSRSLRLLGQRELVTRPLPPEVAENSALSGAAVMSDGQIALIIDCDAVETTTPALVTA